MSEQTLNVFISHVHEDDDGLSKLKNLLEGKGLSIRDSSINAEKPNEASDPNYIKSKILAPHIKWASTLIVYITPQTHNSEWVDWEIEYAHKNGKRIVGVWAYGEAGCELPSELDKLADALVGWNGDNIVDAITREQNIWELPSSEPRSDRQIVRYSCK